MTSLSLFTVLDFPGGSDGKASVYNVRDLGSIPGLGDSLEKEMATRSSILAWEIPWTEEPVGLQSKGSQKSWTNVVTKQQQNIGKIIYII